MAQTLFVSRHAGALDWLRAHHPELAEACRHVTHATPADLAGNIVIGTLPVHLAALCEEYWHLEMDVPASLRGRELTVEDMEHCNCRITRYVVRTFVNAAYRAAWQSPFP